jgi:hypothetical protein
VHSDRPVGLSELVEGLVEELGAARMTDWGLPPTPIQAGKGPDSVCGTTSWSISGARVVPCQVTGPPLSSSAKSWAFSSNSSS